MKVIPAQSKNCVQTLNGCKNGKDSRNLLLSVFYLDLVISVQQCRVGRVATAFFSNITEIDQNGLDGELSYC